MTAAIESALASWREIDLTKLQKDLDAQGLEIVENQKEGLQSRKKLAEQTKDFKRVSDEEKLGQFKILLKSYQTEIDNVTKRSKLAETAFLNLYRLLAEAPDPAPLIAAVADQIKLSTEVGSLQQENKRLKEDLAEAERELATFRSSEGSVTALKGRLSKLEAKMEDTIADRVLAKEIEMKQMMDEKIRIYKEAEYSLQRQLNQVKDQLMSLQSTHDLTQARLVDHSRQYDEEVAVKLAELEIVLSDLERSNQKLSVMERENDLLKKDLKQFKGEAAGNVRNDWQDNATLNRKIKAQDAEITKLLSEIDRFKSANSERDAISARRITELEREAAVRNLEVAQLRETLARYDDYEQIKKELHVMKLIEFSAKDDDGDDKRGYETVFEDNVDPLVDYSLEKLLMEKNKRFQSEITTLKLNVEELQAELKKETSINVEMETRSSSQAKLIAKLEEDMYKLNSIVAKVPARPEAHPQSPTNGASNSEIDPILAITTPSPEVSLGLSQPFTGAISTTAMSGKSAVSSQSIVPPTAQPHPSSDQSSSIVPILASQRDRYRQRNAELEDQAKMLQITISELRTNIDSLQSDNVKLYEKLRYAETFRAGGGTSDDLKQSSDSFTVHVIGNDGPQRRSLTQVAAKTSYPPSHESGSQLYSGTSDEVTVKYRTLYDATLDPFQRFHRQEELRKVKDLNPAERGLLTLTRLLAGNRYSRILFAAYSGALHLLVFATLYMLSQWEECKHDHGPVVVPQPALPKI